MFSLGFVSAIFPEHSFSEVMDIAQRIGYDCVEIMCWPVGKADRRYAGVTHIDVNQLTETRAAENPARSGRTRRPDQRFGLLSQRVVAEC